MTYGWALVLGVVQGLTEFLPVSSSGHLALAGHWGLDAPQPMAFDLALHLATLGVVAAAFAKDLWRFVRYERVVLLWLAVASVPAAVAGLGFRSVFEEMREDPAMIGVGLWVTAAALFLADRRGWEASEEYAGPKPCVAATGLAAMGWVRSLGIGLAQAVALTPGISRSGMTVSAGLFAGLSKEDAVRFGFCLMIPAVGGASLLEAVKFARMPAAAIGDTLPPGPLLAGMAAAAVAGWVALRVLFVTVRRGRLRWFGWYCLGMGLLAFVTKTAGF